MNQCIGQQLAYDHLIVMRHRFPKQSVGQLVGLFPIRHLAPDCLDQFERIQTVVVPDLFSHLAPAFIIFDALDFRSVEQGRPVRPPAYPQDAEIRQESRPHKKVVLQHLGLGLSTYEFRDAIGCAHRAHERRHFGIIVIAGGDPPRRLQLPDKRVLLRHQTSEIVGQQPAGFV